MSNVYDQLFVNVDEDLVGIYNLSQTAITYNNQLIRFRVRLKGNKVAAKINIFKPDVSATTPVTSLDVSEKDDVVLFSGAPARYTYTVNNASELNPFVIQQGEFNIKPKTNAEPDKTIVINLENAIALSGTISNIAGRKLDSTLVTVDGLPIETTTDKDGNYKLYVPISKQIKIQLARTAYTSKDSISTFTTSNNKLNIALKPFDSRAVSINTLAGFRVELTKKEYSAANNVYIISGKLILQNNEVYEPLATNNKLTFINVSVKANAETNDALPVADFMFEEAVLSSKAFGFDVEIDGVPQILFTSLKSADSTKQYYNPAVIGGGKINVKLSKASNAFVTFRDAALVDVTAYERRGEIFNYIYTSPNKTINGLLARKVFNVVFGDYQLGYSKYKVGKDSLIKVGVDTSYEEIALLPGTSLNIRKSETTLDINGVNMVGHFQVPKQYVSRIDSNGRFDFSKFTLDKNYRIGEITFVVSKQRPLKMQLQKIQINVTSLSLFGLGSANFGAGFGGQVFLTSGAQNEVDTNRMIGINYFNLRRLNGGVNFEGGFRLPTNGFTIKNLVIKNYPSEPSALTFSYISAENTFELTAACQLDYNGANNNKLVSSVFPIGIQTFRLKTKDWGLFMVARANIKINAGPATINITNFLVNIGYSMSLNDMQRYLTDSNYRQQTPNVGPPDEIVNEGRTNWAFGIGGGVEFPIRAIKVAASAKLLVANIDGRISAQLAEMSLEVDNAPTFTIAVKASLISNDTVTGFMADGKLLVMGTGLDAGLLFYKYNNGAIRLAAKLKVSLGETGITTGPINWLAIGGGFDFDTYNKRYEVFFTGQITTAGTPKSTAYLDIERLSLLFDLGRCPGGQPVITGAASLWVRNEQWGRMTMNADFCAMTLLITVDASVPIVPNFAKLNVAGIFYGMAPRSGREGALFLYVNASLAGSLTQYFQANATVALGYNYDNNHPLAPQEIKNVWYTIPVEAKNASGSVFNAIYLDANMNIPRKSGGFDASISGFSLLAFRYNLAANASLRLFYKFSDQELYANATFRGDASASVSILGFGLNGSAYINGNVTGGYNDKWYLYGFLEGGLEVWRGNASCNSISYPDACTSLRYPCCWRVWRSSCWCRKQVCVPNLLDPSFKACLSARLEFDYKENTHLNISLRKK